MEMCRACLSTGTDLICMDSTHVDDFNILTNLNVEVSESMPYFICEECVLALKFCTEFRNKCIASDSTIKDMLLEKQVFNQDNMEFNDDTDDKYEIKFQDDCDSDWRLDEETEKKSEIKEEDNVKNITDWMEINKVNCGLCPEMLNSKEALMEHLSIHKVYNNCLLCQYQASSVAQLLAHRMKHVPLEQSGCLFCMKVFMSTASLEFHYMTTHKWDINNECTDDSETEENVLYIPDAGNDNKKNKPIKPLKIPKDVVLNQNEIRQLLRPEVKGITPFFCGLCPLEFDSKFETIKHLANHKTDTACSICELKTASYPNLIAHRMNHLPSNQNGCLFCDKVFKSTASLEFHYLSIHKLGEKDNMPYLCKLCLRSYETYAKLRNHENERHSSRRYTCDYCSRSFLSRTSMAVHLTTHTEEKLFKCDMCDFSCKLSNGLRNHKLRRHTETRVYCNTCRRAFPTQHLMDKHLPCNVDCCVCPLCGVYLKPSSSFARHMRTHTEMSPYKCDKCPAEYRAKSAYKAHMDKHDGYRKFRCEYCPKRFFSQPVLIKHRRIHTGEKPYVCKLCDRAFTGNHNLKVHMKVHGLDLVTKRENTL